MGYVVTAPLVQARRANGSSVHVWEGGSLPSDIDETQLEMLVDSRMVEEGPADGDKPTAKAGVKAWRDYAVAQGMSEEDASAASKDDLVALYGD